MSESTSKVSKVGKTLKSIAGVVTKPLGWAWHHKKKTALILGAGVAAAGGAMYAGYLPTPEIVQTAAQVALTTVAEHPNESLVAGSAVGGIVGWAALKKAGKGAKKVYRLTKNAGSLAKDAAAKGTSLFGHKASSGGAPALQATQGQVAVIDWEKAKFFVPET
jgi:hypothetical protein